MTQALKGSVGVIEKWKECVSDVDSWLGFALGALFVEETFGQGEKSKKDAEKMIENIRDSFARNIHNVTWMDPVIVRLLSIVVLFFTLIRVPLRI